MCGLQVYRARLDDREEVALKFLDAESVVSEATMARFLDEIGILQACRHDRIVGFIGAWIDRVRCHLLPFLPFCHSARMLTDLACLLPSVVCACMPDMLVASYMTE